jgi:SAM-dependent methyltransferase
MTTPPPLDTLTEAPTADAARAAYDASYGRSARSDWHFHDTQDPLVRYLRDRRIRLAMKQAAAMTGRAPRELTALVVCGGVGGEGTYLKNLGCRSVTVSDFSSRALEICRARDRRLETHLLDAEHADLPDGCFDVVLVQDGLHELRRPTVGLTEMLRMSRLITIVIEPHDGFVGRLFGTRWEFHEGVANYVFRWNGPLVESVTHSFLRAPDVSVGVTRLWDHNVVVGRVARLAGGGAASLMAARAMYFLLDAVLAGLGNMMIAVIVQNPRAQSSVGHAR